MKFFPASGSCTCCTLCSVCLSLLLFTWLVPFIFQLSTDQATYTSSSLIITFTIALCCYLFFIICTTCMFPKGTVPRTQEIHNENLKKILACRKETNYSIRRDNTFLSHCRGNQESSANGENSQCT